MVRCPKAACPVDAARHDRMVALVEKMLDLNRRLAAAKTAHEKEMLAGMIDATGRSTGWSTTSTGSRRMGCRLWGDGVMKLSYHTCEISS